jgi:hypothetical protein
MLFGPKHTPSFVINLLQYQKMIANNTHVLA